MFELIQSDNEFKINIIGETKANYINLLLRNGDSELRIPIVNNEAIVTKEHFNNWVLQYPGKNVVFCLEYLFPLNKPVKNIENRSIVEINGEIFENRRRLFKPHRMDLKISGIEPFILDQLNVTPYFNNEGIFIVCFDKTVPVKQYISNRKISKIKVSDKELFLRSNLIVRNFPIETLKLQIQSRSTSESALVKIEPKLISEKKSKDGFKYEYEFQVSFLEQFKSLLDKVALTEDEDNWDLNWIVQQKGYVQSIRIRCGMPKIIVEELLTGEVNFRKNDTIHNFVPYFTLKGHNLAFFYNQYSNEEFTTYRKIVNLGRVKKPKIEDIWIIGEKQYKAQDNGLRFFEYMRKEHPEIEAYYVIRKDSPERENVAHLGNVIDYRSKEHFELIIKAKYICGTHHPDSLYPNRSKHFSRLIKGKRVFLQHGVLGVKNIASIYGKKIKDFQTDLFITSSEIEKNIVLNDFDYEGYEVAVTGLPRFSRLFANDVAVKKQVLIIPTWRDWLTTADRFLQSEYFERYSALINDPELLKLKNEGVDLLFCLHPNMQQFTKYFNIPKEITVIHQGDRLVQDLLKESAILITDYSSVAFDFSFLHKPVIYYQFDRNRFLGKRPSHLDLDETLPGVITDEQDKVVSEIWHSLAQNFEMSDHYKELANNFVKYRDVNSSERIYNAILNIPNKKPIIDVVTNNKIYDVVKSKFRKNKNYFPVMRKLYKVFSKTLKKDPKMILFESGVGKQLSDSPKAIYDELVAQNADYNYVWIYNGKQPIKQSHTRVVKRLSPEYYYYLAKSKYWVNNQNFPHYIKKQKNQTYIQTWHGTPLKRMQNDVKEFKGKDAGYLNRVNSAVKQWDYLVSPSPYATKAFRSAFNFEKEVLEVGYPRNDIFYDKSGKQELLISNVVKKYNIPKDKKVILYAPTFRDDDVNNKNKHLFKLQLDLDKLFENFADEYVILIRAHVIVANKLMIPEEFKDFVINVSDYEDIQHLYLASDICITDYSSVMFDFAHTKRPLLFFTYDLQHYKENLRGFYMDFEKEAPGPLMLDTDEVITAIANLDEVVVQYKEKYSQFYDKYCGIEQGNASEQIVKKFFK